MKKWRITDECPHCYSTTTCHVEADTEQDAKAKHKTGDSEYIEGDASVAHGNITCEELTK